MMVRRVIVGPTDAQGMVRRERGTITVTALPPPRTQLASVEVLCNSALIGEPTKAPYEVEFNTATVPDGAQVLKAIGLDTAGKQVWTATTKIDVRNSATGMSAEPVVVGPTDWQGAPRRERGTITVTAVPPPNVQVRQDKAARDKALDADKKRYEMMAKLGPNASKIVGNYELFKKDTTEKRFASVEIFCNSALIGQKSQPPYEVQFNTTTVPDGAHVLKAIALDASGKQVWTATTKIDVRNAGPSIPTGPEMANASSSPPTGPKPPIVKPPAGPTPGTENKTIEHPVTPKPAPKPVTSAGSLSLNKTYSSTRNGFSVGYPAGWTAKSMRPRKSGNVWIAFTPAGKKGTLAVNVRRMRLDPNSSADVFAKYNPYVTKWERKTVLDSQAFGTVSNLASKKVIHRLIVIKNGYAWMLNCVDTSGQASDGSGKLFQSVVDSFKVGGPAKAKAASVTEVKKKP